MILVMAALAAMTSPLPGSAAESAPRPVLETPVRVVVTIEEHNGADTAVFHVGDEATGRVTTLYNDAAGQDLRAQVRWQPPYLLVHSTSGGTCWDCTGEAIFKIENGQARRIGDINSDIRPGQLPALTANQFLTLYSKLELAAGFCHACSPSFLVSLFERGDRLEPDAESSWSINRDVWQRAGSLAPSAPPLPESETRLAWENERFSLLVSALALAKYCGHEEEFAALRTRWAPMLDTDARRRMDEALDMVKPLEPVVGWRKIPPY